VKNRFYVAVKDFPKAVLYLAIQLCWNIYKEPFLAKTQTGMGHSAHKLLEWQITLPRRKV